MAHTTPLAEGATAPMDMRGAFEERYRELVHHVAQTAPAATLAKALASTDPFSGLAGALGSAMTLDPPRDPLAAARARSVATRARRLERAGGVLRVGEVANLLGVSTQAVQARRSRGTLLALPQPNGEHVYPACQFEKAGVLPGLSKLLRAFRDIDPWTQLTVLLAASERFAGRSALDLLREGENESALQIAGTYGEPVG
ncbi:MAG: hypothetical protein ACREKN_01300 [Longimicrobiaceae bacterium]